MTKEMRSGFTTGACMAAGVKAGLLYLQGEYCETVDITALDGTPLHIPIKEITQTDEKVRIEIIKDAGDDPDITNGTSVYTTIRPLAGTDIIFKAGLGIGTVSKPGLQVPVGEPSINPGPRQMVRNVIKEMRITSGLEVEISIPAGIELAKRTLNPVLGVVGGISVIGTTGVLRPMSEEGFKNSLLPQIDVAKAAGYDTQVFVPGKIGERIALQHGVPQQVIVQTSNFIGFMLEAAAERKIKRVLLLGHLGKLAKVAAGVFYTHNRIGDGRLEAIAAYAAAEGMSQEGVRRILAANTTEDAMPVLEELGFQRVYDILAARASLRAERYTFGDLKVGTILVTLKGEILGMDDTARMIGSDFGWNIK